MVDAYISRQPSPHKEILQQLRNIILKIFPDITEEMKMGVPWYEGKYYLVALKDHVNLGVSINGLTPKEKAYLEGHGKTMKHLSFYSVSEINEESIIPLLRIIQFREPKSKTT